MISLMHFPAWAVQCREVFCAYRSDKLRPLFASDSSWSTWSDWSYL